MTSGRQDTSPPAIGRIEVARACDCADVSEVTIGHILGSDPRRWLVRRVPHLSGWTHGGGLFMNLARRVPN